MKSYTLLAGALAVFTACGSDDPDDAERSLTGDSVAVATALASGRAELSPEEIEAGRLDDGWKQYVQMDGEAAGSPDQAAGASGQAGRTDPSTPARSDGSADSGTAGASNADSAGAVAAGQAGSGSGAGSADSAAASSGESWDDITPEAVNAEPRTLPIHGDVAGPSVAKVQILLDQASFSPGVIDGRWGKNTEKAVYWFQKANGLNATGRVDQRTLGALAQRARGRQVVQHQLAEQDVSGPFEELPEDVYARAEKPCLCYESQREQLGEVFHSTPELLEQLNPGVDLATVQPGTSLNVPGVEPFHLASLPDGKYTGGGRVARIVISDGGHYVHGLDQAGSILYHFPSTLGSDYAPSPSGDFSVESITFDPTWHYKPDLLTGVDPSKEDAVLPAGPNNAVGIVWMQLSKPHYGIHGTSAPETIGYATSHGCVRLTNWDAAVLGRSIPPGVPVEFRDVAGRE